MKKLSFGSRGDSNRNSQSGFTLIEIIISVGIIASLSIYAVSAMSNQIETRNRLQQSNEATHSAHSAMMRLTEDLRHAYMIGRPMFVMTEAPRLLFMSQSHQSLIANRPEANIAYVQYLVCPDSSAPAKVCKSQSDSNSPKKQLVRVTDPSVKKTSDDAMLDGVAQVLVNDLKEFKVTAWNGQEFIKDWNTERSDFGRKLPKMVKVDLSVFMPEDMARKQFRDENSSADLTERPAMSLSTTVYLLYTNGQPDLKEPKKDLGWVE
jgi:prepilin-type N-terminal cleavage/methylation domain-containing protein